MLMRLLMILLSPFAFLDNKLSLVVEASGMIYMLYIDDVRSNIACYAASVTLQLVQMYVNEVRLFLPL
jgi:hypothetical protein